MRRSERLGQKAQKAKDEERLRVWQEEMRREDEERQRVWQERMRREEGISIYIDASRVSGVPGFSLSVKPTDTILSIKNEIAKTVGYDPQYQVLTIAGIELDDRYTVYDYREVIFDGSTLVLTTRGGFTLGRGRPRTFRFGGGGESRPREPGAFSFGGQEPGPTFTLGPPREDGSAGPRTFRFGGRGEPRPRTQVKPGTFGFGGGGVGKKAVFHA
jgi:hypothetical protein